MTPRAPGLQTNISLLPGFVLVCFVFSLKTHLLRIITRPFNSQQHVCKQNTAMILVRGLLGTGPHSRRWVAGKPAKLHLYIQPLPIIGMLHIAGITAWPLPPVRSAATLDSQRSRNPPVNCTCEGSGLRTHYLNPMPDLGWSSGCDGERLQIQIIISGVVWLHRNHNKSIACDSYQNPISEWHVTVKLHLAAGYKAIPSPPAPVVCGQIVPWAGPWCQKCWGPLL